MDKAQTSNTGLNCYDLLSWEKPAKVVIINEKTFVGEPTFERYGSEKDVEGLKTLFESLKCDVSVHTDMTMKEIHDLVTNLRQEDYSSYGGLLVTCLSHGQQGTFVTSDMKELNEEMTIFRPFNNLNCPSLLNKPRVFLMGYCRGVNEDDGIWTKTAVGEIDEDEYLGIRHQPQKMSSNTDTLIIHSTIPDMVSYRNPGTGSPFIQEFCKVMSQNKDKCLRDILDLTALQLTTQEFSGKVQMFEYTVRGLFKKIVFN